MTKKTASDDETPPGALGKTSLPLVPSLPRYRVELAARFSSMNQIEQFNYSNVCKQMTDVELLAMLESI